LLDERVPTICFQPVSRVPENGFIPTLGADLDG